MFEYETRKERVIPLHRFLIRMLSCATLAAGLMLLALAAGVVGYRVCAGYTWVDSLLNAAMILTGMGQINSLETTTAKLFASFYALFSGVVFVTAMSLTISPLFHRVLHQFHLADEDMSKKR